MSAAAPPPPPAPTPQQQQFAGYRGFGSFMVEQSVEELVAAADAGGADWAEPAWPTLALAPEAVLSACAQPAPPPAFGHGFRAAHFFLSPEWTFVNHGAFGASARVALCAAQRWREHCEAQPLACLDRELFPQLVRVLARLAALLRCRAGDLALVPNATYALNVCVAAARAELRAGDAVFMLDIGYGSVKTMLRAACAS